MADNAASLYVALGGEAAVTAAVDSFYERVLGDATLAPFFVNTNLDRLKAQQRNFFTQALGGPQVYTGRSMQQAHGGFPIKDEHFNSVAQHLTDTLAGLGVPAAQVQQVIGLVAPLKGDIVSA